MSDETNYSPRDVPLRDSSKDKTGSLIRFPRSHEHPPDNLPLELSSFVGREREVAEVKGLLAERRLVSLTGPGGCGKTRLALAVAQDVVEEFEDGVWWVELASTSDQSLVPQAVAAALGERETLDRSLTETLVEHLGSKKTLLIMDNCEHLVDASASLVDTLLRSCPNLRILTTSRQALGIGGENAWLVPSLLLPDLRHLPPVEALQRYEAISLFVERAQDVVSTFKLTEHNAPAVTSLCRRLDGMPLAIELASARIRVLSVEQISSRLEDSFTLLTGGSRTALPRQRTIRAAIDWSYRLLTEEERVLLWRLSVFVGGFTLEAAEEVCSGKGIEEYEVLDLVAQLVDKSLVTVAEQDSEARYRMLEPIRQFGREKLQESKEAPEVGHRHAEHYLALAERAEPELLGADQGLWLQRLRTEFANLREAHAWTLEPGQGTERAQELRLRLAAALWRFWGMEGFEEGKRWLRTALEKDPGGFPAARAKALGGLGFILLFQQDYGRAIAALEEAIVLYKDLRDEIGTAFALGSLGWAVLHGYYHERVPTFIRESEALIEGGLEGSPRAYLSIVLASATLWQGDIDLAASRLKEAIAMCRELGNLRDAAMGLFNLGGIELRRGDTERAMKVFKEGATISGQLGDMLGVAYYVWIFGGVNARLGKPARAARLWGAAEALREQMGMSFSRYDLAHSDYEQDLTAVRSVLDDATFDAVWDEGRAMSFEQVIEYALGKPTPHEVEEDAHAPAAGAAVVRVFALGPARVEKDGSPLDSSPDWIQKPQELLYYLLSHPEGRTKEQIGLALWPNASNAQLRSSFHDTVYRLRRALGGKEWIVFKKGRYTIDRSLPYSFDVEAFEENLSEARRVRSEAPDQVIRHLQEAASLYGGDFLEDSADSEWAMDRQEELRRAYGEALLLLGRLLFARERYAEAAEAYRKAIAHDGFLEEAHRGLMRCYAAVGERGRALRHYEDLVTLLKEQLGTAPALETSALHERLRTVIASGTEPFEENSGV